ncbi:unnamed protein product, partial [marine sediment metagenome]
VSKRGPYRFIGPAPQIESYQEDSGNYHKAIESEFTIFK